MLVGTSAATWFRPFCGKLIRWVCEYSGGSQESGFDLGDSGPRGFVPPSFWASPCSVLSTLTCGQRPVCVLVN